MSEKEKSSKTSLDQVESAHDTATNVPMSRRGRRAWWRSPLFAAWILGVCNFCAPGCGTASPWIINAANSLTFCLMIITAFLASTIMDLVGVNFALFLGGIGFAPYCAGLYCNVVYGTEWFVLLGAAFCGLSAGLFWAIEAGK